MQHPRRTFLKGLTLGGLVFANGINAFELFTPKHSKTMAFYDSPLTKSLLDLSNFDRCVDLSNSLNTIFNSDIFLSKNRAFVGIVGSSSFDIISNLARDNHLRFYLSGTHYLNSNTITHNLTLPKEMISRVNVALGKDSFKNTLNYTYSNFILSGFKFWIAFKFRE